MPEDVQHTNRVMENNDPTIVIQDHLQLTSLGNRKFKGLRFFARSNRQNPRVIKLIVQNVNLEFVDVASLQNLLKAQLAKHDGLSIEYKDQAIYLRFTAENERLNTKQLAKNLQAKFRYPQLAGNFSMAYTLKGQAALLRQSLQRSRVSQFFKLAAVLVASCIAAVCVLGFSAAIPLGFIAAPMAVGLTALGSVALLALSSAIATETFAAYQQTKAARNILQTKLTAIENKLVPISTKAISTTARLWAYFGRTHEYSPADYSVIDLLKAVSTNQISKVKVILQKNPKLVNQYATEAQLPDMQAILPSYKRYQTALHLAATNQDSKMVQLLLSRGARPTMNDEHDHAPRFYAGNTVLAKVLRDGQNGEIESLNKLKGMRVLTILAEPENSIAPNERQRTNDIFDKIYHTSQLLERLYNQAIGNVPHEHEVMNKMVQKEVQDYCHFYKDIYKMITKQEAFTALELAKLKQDERQLQGKNTFYQSQKNHHFRLTAQTNKTQSKFSTNSIHLQQDFAKRISDAMTATSSLGGFYNALAQLNEDALNILHFSPEQLQAAQKAYQQYSASKNSAVQQVMPITENQLQELVSSFIKLNQHNEKLEKSRSLSFYAPAQAASPSNLVEDESSEADSDELSDLSDAEDEAAQIASPLKLDEDTTQEKIFDKLADTNDVEENETQAQEQQSSSYCAIM